MSLAQKIVKGSLTLLLLRLIQRGIGVISLLILARLLTPDDFGIVAIATLIVYFFDAISSAGSLEYIIQKDNPSTDDLNTAWTINIISKSIVWFLFVISVPWISEYFEKENLENALYITSLILLISATENSGMYLFRKQLNFKPMFKLTVLQKVASFTTVITLALIYQSYWAMIWGNVVARLVQSVGTYLLHDFRPKLSLKKFEAQWSFSKWVMLKSALGYSRTQFDTFLISKFFGFGSIGGYELMKNLSSMPATEIIKPATEPLLASFSQVKNDEQRLRYQVSISLIIILLTITPLAYFIFLFSMPIITVFLGEQWIEYASILSALTILLATYSFSSILNHLGIALSKVKVLFYYDSLTFLIIAIALGVFASNSIEDFALLRAVLEAICVTGLFLYLTSKISFSILVFFKNATPIVLSTLLAGELTERLFLSLTLNVSLALILLTLCFLLTYSVSLLAAYYLHYKRSEEWRHIMRITTGFYKTAYKKVLLGNN